LYYCNCRCDCAGCQQWTSSPNTNFANGQVNAARTVQACKTACFGNSQCRGFDWVPALALGQQCWLTGPWSGGRGSPQGVTHYFLDRNCAGKLRHFNVYCNSFMKVIRVCVAFTVLLTTCFAYGGIKHPGCPGTCGHVSLLVCESEVLSFERMVAFQ